MKKIFLIDGHALIFRMYYAFMRRPMVNSKGVDTSILFGFTKYLLEIISKEHPTHIAVCFDPPAKTFRHEAYPEYKANRTAAPELVKAALDPLVEIMETLGLKVVMQPGFEADDVIGTLAARFEGEDSEVYMVTPDKDLGQMVSDHIKQFKPGKNGAEHEIVTPKTLCELHGIESPRRIVDILTLWGDASDNVPGVQGVGEIGARKLIGQYGSVENIYNNLDKLSPKLRESFEKAQEHIQLSKFLVTIRTDVPLDISESDIENRLSMTPAVNELFDRYEFNSLKKLVPLKDATLFEQSSELSEEHSLEPQQSPFGLISAIAIASGVMALNVSERSVVIACGEKYVVTDSAQAAPLLENEKIAKIGFSIKEGIEILRRKGSEISGEIYDIELMHYLLNPERAHKLDILTRGYLNCSLEKEAPAKVVQQDLFAPVSELSASDAQRAARECVAISLIYPHILKELEEQKLLELYKNIEMPLIGVLAQMELDGVKMDPGRLSNLSRELASDIVNLESNAREMAQEPSLNLSSPKQVGMVLYEKLNLNPKVKKTATGSYPTDEETLAELSDLHPIVNKILEFRAAKKLLSTYIEPLPQLINPRTGKIHTTYTQALTATGRLSSVRPNLQNIPIRTPRGQQIRTAFVPSNPGGVIVSADYSQIELRIMAHLSGDDGMVADFLNGDDIHAATAAKIYKVPVEEVTKEQRRRAKTANFGIIYGISAFGLSQRLGIARSESKELIEEYFKNYPGIQDYIEKVLENAREDGYVETLFGRKRFLPDINSRNAVVRKMAERNAVNAPIQGSAADIIKLAMIAVARRLEAEKMESRMVLQVHDELVFDAVGGEVEKLMAIVREEMENVVELKVPLLVDCNYGEDWLEAH
ncbi:MAG: DNA polymerase I [Bacteroidales bacterium]|nr:DNA polymerase I [Bacteroidales bacterium]